MDINETLRKLWYYSGMCEGMSLSENKVVSVTGRELSDFLSTLRTSITESQHRVLSKKLTDGPDTPYDIVEDIAEVVKNAIDTGSVWSYGLIDLSGFEQRINDLIASGQKGKDANIMSDYVLGNMQFQGRIGISEESPNEEIECSFASGIGEWSCYRFTDGKRRYRVTVTELEDGE